jgi:hypothetical protein
MMLFLATLFVFGFVIFIMAIGVIVGNRQIKGSCGGLGGCEFCPSKDGQKGRCDLPCDGVGAKIDR